MGLQGLLDILVFTTNHIKSAGLQDGGIKIRPPSITSFASSYLKGKLFLVLFNMNKGVDNPMDYFLIWVLTTPVTIGYKSTY